MKLTSDRKFDNEVHDDDVVGFERSPVNVRTSSMSIFNRDMSPLWCLCQEAQHGADDDSDQHRENSGHAEP